MQYIYPERESKTLEFKSQLPNLSHLNKTCVAFANGIGGKIIIGIEDKTHEIIGISDEIRNRVYDELPNSIYDATSPPLLVEIYEKSFGDLSVIIIDVPASIKKPVFIKSEGSINGVYLRAGSNTRKANSEYIEELMRENKRIHYDEESIAAQVSILSHEMLHRLYKKIDKRILQAEKIVNATTSDSKQILPTVAGTLAFCEKPDDYIPEAMIICTRFLGKDGRDIIQTEEIRGTIETQIEISFQLIRSWLLRDYALVGVKLAGTLLIPEIALREAITNAVIHRKYWIPGAIKIALYDDRLEIFNPGGFPGLVDINNLGDGTTYLRNPNLARIARRLGLVEKLGTGIKMIFESFKKANIIEPEFIENADSIKVIFHFLPATQGYPDENTKILSLFAFKKEISISDVETFLNVSRNTATRKLNQLIKSGKIKRNGRGPAVRYSFDKN
ncbi:MAG: ATP-binding protein [Legionellales bacterium]|jgi:predicted HTH transcriptional regulator